MKKTIAIVLALLVAIGGIWGYPFYKKYKGNNVSKSGYFYIPSNANFNEVLDSIKPFIADIQSFEEVALSKKLDKSIKAGRYKIQKGENNSQLVNKIKVGLQTEDTFRIKDFDDVYQMVGRVARKTETDSAEFIRVFEQIAQNKGLNSAEDLKPYFFSDTYFFFWTTTPEQFFQRFEKDYENFWNEERLAKEKKLDLSRNQIYALASIVQKESGGKPDEQKTIAGLYLNRYKKGMKLQSDPTVIYAINKEHRFTKTIKRIYHKDLSHPSPYNTYANIGIPPGPICMVNKTAIDNVLNAENHHYIFMCADPQRLGYHKFTDSYEEHAKNAKAYHDWLNKNKIK
ncbi:MAG: endolytic transglycosylase MltG [Flavobacteriaceae bacterium]|nr:endolytic transglycosylase MltG [Flavobacteriaceae bacterium]